MAYRLQVKIGNFTFLSEQEWTTKEDAAEARDDAEEMIADLDSLGKLPFEVSVATRTRFGPGWSACK